MRIGSIASKLTSLATMAIVAAVPSAATAQTIDQLTDHKTAFTGPGGFDDAGTVMFVGSSSNQWGGNPSNTFQLVEIDPVTFTGAPLTSFRFGTATSDQGSDVPPTVYVSDDGNWLVFISPSDPLGTNPDFSPELFVRSRDGSVLTQLTSDTVANAGSIRRVAFSGNGERIAFASNSELIPGMNPDRREQLYTVDRTGANLTQHTFATDGKSYFGLGISDDGARIVFAFDGNLDGTMNDDLTSEVFTLELDGSMNPIRQITDDPLDANTSFQTAISGDGSTIAFASEADFDGSNTKNETQLFAVDFDGSNLGQLFKGNVPSTDPVTTQAPALTDDGSRIYFHTNSKLSGGENSDLNFEIMRINRDKTNLTALTESTLNEGSFFPFISADGMRIAFNSFEESFDNTSNALLVLPEMYVMDDPDADGTDAMGCDINCNINAITVSIGGKQFDPFLTYDGTKIFFMSQADLLGLDADQGGELYSILPDGTALTQLTEFDSADDQRLPFPLPDGSRIAFISNADPFGTNPDNSLELFVIDGDGDASSLEQLTDLPDATQVNNPFFIDDGSKILYDATGNPTGTNNDGDRDVFMIEPDGTLNTITQLVDGTQGAISRNAVADSSGTWFAFESNEDLTGDNADDSTEIFLKSFDGMTTMQLTDIDGTAQRATDPEMTADASLIAFVSDADLDGTIGIQLPGNNPELNLEIYVYERGTGKLNQLTVTTSGSSFGPRFSRNGDFLYFTTNAPELVEPDPDEPFHFVRADLRAGVASATFERIGGFEAGQPFLALPDQTGQKAVLSGSGNFTYENPDALDEIWFVDQLALVGGIGIAGKSSTAISWTQQSGPMRYDVIRGSVANMAFGAGVIDLGAVACIGEDIKDTSTTPSGSDDAALPLPGEIFFYTYRGDQGANLTPGSYGQSSGGLEREPTSGGCAP